MKHAFLLLSLVAFISCNSPARFEANRAASADWLGSKVGGASVNVSGTWEDAAEDKWGMTYLTQNGNRVTGKVGLYTANGIVSGSRVYLTLEENNWVYYTVEANVQGSMLEGLYSDKIPFEESSADPFAFRRISN